MLEPWHSRACACQPGQRLDTLAVAVSTCPPDDAISTVGGFGARTHKVPYDRLIRKQGPPAPWPGMFRACTTPHQGRGDWSHKDFPSRWCRGGHMGHTRDHGLHLRRRAATKWKALVAKRPGRAILRATDQLVVCSERIVRQHYERR